MAINLKLPAGSADCHVHIYGPRDRYPWETEGRFAPTRAWTVEDLFALWDSIGVSRGVIVHASNGGLNNEVTFDALKRYPDKLRAVAVLQEDVSDKRLDELTDVGFKGARINMLWQDGKPVSSTGMGFDWLKKNAPRLAERGWHAQLWIETGDLDAMSAEIEALPLNFVIDHMGRTMSDKGVGYPGFQKFLDRLKTGRYWCKVSGADRNTRKGAPYGDTEDFMKALVEANPDQIVWGSDWPHVGHTPEAVPAEQTLLELFFKCVPDEMVRRNILIDNPTKLYGF